MDRKQLTINTKKYLQTTLNDALFSDVALLVKISAKISENYELSKQEKMILEMASWFSKRPELAKSFLTSENIEATLLEKIIFLIELKADPDSLLEKIMLDAASYNYSAKGFKKQNELQRLDTGMDRQEWLTKTISEMKAHKYYTDYGLAKLEIKKQRWMEKLETELNANINAAKKDRPERSIEMMFKINASNHQHLSSMADNKAHILITVNSIILSILISVLLRKLDENTYLAYPTFVLLAVSVISITMSIIAITPVVHDLTRQTDNLPQEKSNLLFFGNVSEMNIDDFILRMLGTMEDKDHIYHMLIRNAYLHSVVLGRKSRLLKIAYNIFMYGLIISVVAFITVSIFHTPQSSVLAPAALSPAHFLKAK